MVGIMYPSAAWLIFATGFWLEGGCNPDFGECDPFFDFIRPFLFILGMPNLVVWSVIEYFGVQLPTIFILGDQAHTQIAVINTVVVPAVFVPLTLIWTTIGATFQWLIRDIKKQFA